MESNSQPVFNPDDFDAALLTNNLEINDEDVESAWALLRDLAPDDLLVQEYSAFTHNNPPPAMVPVPNPPQPQPQPQAIVKTQDKKRRRASRATAEELGRKLTRREANTLCEARRRDKLNECIQELANLAQLPYKSTNKDKCTVLSHVAAVLRTRKHVNAQLDAALAGQLSSASQSELWHSSEMGFFILSQQMQVIDVNKWLHTALGYSHAKELGNGMSFVHPDFVGQIYIDMARLLAGEVPRIQHHERLKCKSGEYKWFMTSVALGDLKGQPVVYGVVVETQPPGTVMTKPPIAVAPAPGEYGV